MNLAIEQLAQRILDLSGEVNISGASDQEIEELLSVWQVRALPRAYVDFLKLMGRGAGSLLKGTDAFLPRIKQMPSFVAEFRSENDEFWRLPQESIVFAMHQGYQVYYLEASSVDDPPVALYVEGDSEPIRRWESFTSFLRHQLTEDYGRLAG